MYSENHLPSGWFKFFGKKRGELGNILRALCNCERIKLMEAEKYPGRIRLLIKMLPKIAVRA